MSTIGDIAEDWAISISLGTGIRFSIRKFPPLILVLHKAVLSPENDAQTNRTPVPMKSPYRGRKRPRPFAPVYVPSSTMTSPREIVIRFFPRIVHP